MKPIILDINEMSDSKEIYESRPCPVFILFIYLILVITTVFTIWAALFKLDVVIKGNGIITAKDDLSTVTNIYAGNILRINIKDGQHVSAGDILYTLDANDISLEEDRINAQIDTYSDKIAAIDEYIKWLNNQDYEIEATEENLYYDEVFAKQKILLLALENTENQLGIQNSDYDTKITSNQDLMKYYDEEISKLKLLSAGITTLTNPFDTSESYYNARMAQYLTERNNLITEYDASINATQNEITQINTNIDEQNKKIADIENKIKQANEAINSANKVIDEANAKILETGETLETEETGETLETEESGETLETEESGEIGEVLEIGENEENSVSDELNIEEIISQQKEIIQENKNIIETIEKNKQNAEEQIKTYKNTISSKENSIKTIELKKSNELDDLEKQTISSVELSILTYEQNLTSLHGAITEKENAKNSLNEVGTSNEKGKIIQSEIESVLKEKSGYNEQVRELESNLLQLKKKEDNTIVKASISGTVNFSKEITVGDYLSSGTDVLKIIPDGDSLQVESFIKNADIAKISPNMKVKYEIAAFPSSEYGNITGEVKFVSADLKTNVEDGSAYYSIKSSVNDMSLCNSKGEIANLKIGMACQTKIIVEQKSVLSILLEKINLID